MVRVETVFGAGASVTPDFAAQLAHCASKYAANVYLEKGNMRLSVDSLIGILSLDLRRGAKVTISADGLDEQVALDAVCEFLNHGAK